MAILLFAGWSSLAARRAHNPKVGGSNPPPATIDILPPLSPYPFAQGFFLPVVQAAISAMDVILPLGGVTNGSQGLA